MPATNCRACGQPLDGFWPGGMGLRCELPQILGETEEEIDYSKDRCPACGRRFVLRASQPRLVGEEDHDPL